MKKLFSLILALAMAFALSAPAFAAAPAGQSYDECECTKHPDVDHYYSLGTLDEYGCVTGYRYYSDINKVFEYGFSVGRFSEVRAGWYYIDENYAPIPCSGHASEGPQTTVTMNITKGNTYTLTVPASVTVTKEGFENLPIKVDSDNDMESTKKVTVTASSANSWKLKEGTKSVDYILVADSTATSATTAYDFAAADINPTNGKTQASGVYVTADNYKAADSGTYTDTITFTSEVVNAN